ncbi:MAG: GNAT family N-acetyltransferase [Rhizobiaceae bacterium]
MNLRPPEPLSNSHIVASFDCGETSLNSWLQNRALANQVTGASRTFVVCGDINVVGYYALAANSVSVREATGRMRRNMPDPVPVVILGRLATDVSARGKGLGDALLRDACQRVLHAAETIGIRGILVHALNEDAARFYDRNGFESSPFNPLMMMATLANLKAGMALD